MDVQIQHLAHQPPRRHRRATVPSPQHWWRPHTVSVRRHRLPGRIGEACEQAHVSADDNDESGHGDYRVRWGRRESAQDGGTYGRHEADSDRGCACGHRPVQLCLCHEGGQHTRPCQSGTATVPCRHVGVPHHCWLRLVGHTGRGQTW